MASRMFHYRRLSFYYHVANLHKIGGYISVDLKSFNHKSPEGAVHFEIFATKVLAKTILAQMCPTRLLEHIETSIVQEL